MKTFAITIEIDREEFETQFIDVKDLRDLEIRYRKGEGDKYDRGEMDWDYDVVEVHEFSTIIEHPVKIHQIRS